MKCNNSLKQRAFEAKRRLQNGYTEVNRFGMLSDKVAGDFLTTMKNAETLQKICCLVESGNDVHNPLSSLIDKQLFSSLTVAEQQRYIFRLSDAYICVKNYYSNSVAKKY